MERAGRASREKCAEHLSSWEGRIFLTGPMRRHPRGGGTVSRSSGTAPPGVYTAGPRRPVPRVRAPCELIPLRMPLCLHDLARVAHAWVCAAQQTPQGLADVLTRQGEGRPGGRGPEGGGGARRPEPTPRPPGEPHLPEIWAGPALDPADAQQTLCKPPSVVRFCRHDLAHRQGHAPGCCSRPQCLGQCLVHSWDSTNNS